MACSKLPEFEPNYMPVSPELMLWEAALNAACNADSPPASEPLQLK